MTAAQLTHCSLSANELFKLRYPRYLRGAVLAALVLTTLFVWLLPRYEPRPYVLREKIIEIIDLEVIPEQALPEDEIPPPPALPIPEIVAAPEAGEEVPEFDSADIFNPPPLTPTDISPRDEFFVPSSTPPRLLVQAKPDYPELARKAGIEGTVLVKVLVGRDGRVKTTEVIQGVHPLLDRAALAAARRCRFEPGKQREAKVPAHMAIPYRFRLH